jgi:hypothetical protein
LLVYFDRIYNGVPQNSKEPADEQSRKTVITAAGWAIPVISATRKNGPVDNLWMLKRAAVCLLLAVALWIITLLEMSRRYEKVRQGDQQALEATLAENAKTIAQKIKSSPQGDYTEALKLTLDFCPSKSATPGLPKKDIGAPCLWAHFSLVGPWLDCCMSSGSSPAANLSRRRTGREVTFCLPFQISIFRLCVANSTV